MNKKIYYFTIILLLTAYSSFAQEASKIKPLEIVWIADGDTLSIEDAQTKGAKLPNELQIAVILDPRTIGKLNGQKLEYRWYRQGPTRSYLTNSIFEQINTSAPGNKAYTLITGRTGLRTGWWKVQIIAYADRKLLEYKNKQEFWINLK